MFSDKANKLAWAIQEIDDFNFRCGNGKMVTPPWNELKEKFINQIMRVQEELNEVLVAINEGDLPEILKETGDVFVTTAGLVELCNNHVGDISAAIIDVCENNNLKYTHDKEEVDEWLAHYLSEYNPAVESDGYYVCATEEEPSGMVWYCIRRKSDNKIMKHPRQPKLNTVGHIWIME